MLVCWDMLGYGSISWDMVRCGGRCRDVRGGVLHVVRSLTHALQRFLCCPPWFLHLLKKLFKLKRTSRSVAKTGFSEGSKSMAGAMF